MSNAPAIVDAEFTEVARPGPTEDELMDVVTKWFQRYHGIDRRILLEAVPHLDAYRFTLACKKSIAAAALELIGEIDLARKVAR